jgi:hypothetical protein
MEIIPLIKLKNKKIIEEHEKFLGRLGENKTLYVYDIDGIAKDKPDLCIYQKLSKKYNLWIDNAPRDLGDVVDVFLTGATSVIIRKKYCPQIRIEQIREISENKVYEHLRENENEFFSDVDGLVLINEKQTAFDFQTNDLLKKYSRQNDVFVYEADMSNLAYWSKSEIKGLLIDVSKWEEAEKWVQREKS